MKNGITKIGLVLWGICLIGWIVIGFVVLAVDVLMLVAKLLFIFPQGTGPIEGPWVMPLSRLGAGLAGGFVLLVGTSMVLSAAKRRSSGSSYNFRSEYGPAIIILLVVFMAGLLALLMPLIPARVLEITLSPHGAQPTSLEWNEGVVIRFANTSSQRQILCTGAQTTCQAVDGAPAELAPPGLILAPGQSTDVTFPTAGDYHLISPTTPAILLDIIVDAPNPNRPDPCGVVCWGLARYGSNG
jgi:hypothetical protein